MNDTEKSQFLAIPITVFPCPYALCKSRGRSRVCAATVIPSPPPLLLLHSPRAQG